MLVLFLIISVFNTGRLFAQTNFYTDYQQQQSYYDSLIQIRGADSMQGTGYNQYKRWFRYWAPKLLPDNDYDVYHQGLLYQAATYSPPESNASPNQLWKLIGPNDTPIEMAFSGVGTGQIHYIYIDPHDQTGHTKFACSPVGGLFRSTDNGETWVNAGTDKGLSKSGVSSVVVSSIEPTMWFVTTGNGESFKNDVIWQRSIGLYRTWNSGSTWERMLIDTTRLIQNMRKVIEVESQGGFSLIVTTTEGLYRIDDAHLPEYRSSQLISGEFYDIEVDIKDPSVLFASGSNSTGLYKIDLNSNSSTLILNPDTIFIADTVQYPKTRRLSIEQSPADSGFLYVMYSVRHGNYSYLYRYDKDSSSWTKKGKLNSDFNGYARKLGWTVRKTLREDSLLTVFGQDAFRLHIYNDSLSYYHTDTAKSAIPEFIQTGDEVHDDFHYLMIEGNDEVIWAGTDGGVYKGTFTNDTTINWEVKNKGLGVTTVEHIDVKYEPETRRTLVTSGQFDCGSNTYESNDEINWTITHRLGGDGYQSSIENFNDYYLSHQYVVSRFQNDIENKLNQSDVKDCLTGDTFNSYLNHDTYYSRNGTTLYGAGSQGVVKYSNSKWSEWSKFHDDTEYPEMGCDSSGVWRIISNSNGVKYASTFGSTKPESYHFYHRVYMQDTENINNWVLVKNQPDTTKWIGSLHFGGYQDDLYVGMGGKIYLVENTKSDQPEWTLLNYNLPNNDSNIQINSIEREVGRLWIATDRGVFYLDEGQSSWVDYTENLPNTEVTDIKVKNDRVYVGTYGRGVWFASAPDCFADIAAIEIVGANNNVGPFETKTYLNNIKIPSDSIYTVEGTLFMGADCKIIVEPRGKLIVNGGTITKACPDLWKGIEVWGTASQSQDTLFQGLAELKNGAQLEYAAIAIDCGKSIGYDTAFIYDDTYNGGMVYADDAIFYDNLKAVKMGVYPLEYQIKKFDSKSYFKNCNFTYTDDIYRFGQRPYEMVILSRIDGVRFEGCDWFKNTPEHTGYNRVTGIVATSAAIKVMPFTGFGTPDSCSFTDFDYGIRSYDFYQKGVSTLIEYSKFEGNYIGITLSANDFAQVTHNSFNVKAENDPAVQNCGMYLSTCSGYKVEENEFFTTLSSPSGADSIAGLVVSYSGPEDNQIYNNVFHDLPYATIAQGVNRSPNGQSGLVIKCNDYTNNYQDIAVTPEADPWYDFGVKKDQGLPGDAVEDPAGNTFSWMDNGNDYSDFNNENFFFYYYHHDQGWPPTTVRPIDYTSITITPHSQQGNFYNKLDACPSNSGESSSGVLKSNISTNNYSADSVEAELVNLVDDGNTATMNLDVQTSYPAETMEVRQELLDASPYLSDTVMVSAVEKESVLPNSIITEVLVSNPQSAKSDKVLDKLDERVQPPSNNQMARIHANDTVLGDKQLKEALITGYRGKAAQNAYDLVRLHMNDSTGSNKTDSILYTLNYVNTLASYYSKAFLYLIEGDSINVITTLTDVESDFELTENQEDEHDYYSDYFNLLLYQRSIGKTYTDLDSSQLVTLNDIIDNTYGKVGSYARNLSYATKGIFHHERIMFPDNTEKSEKVEWELTNEGEKENTYFKLYPNPAREYISIEYNFDHTVSNLGFKIITLQGVDVLHFATSHNQGLHNIDLRDWKPGTYIIILVSGSKSLQSEKFTKY